MHQRNTALVLDVAVDSLEWDAAVNRLAHLGQARRGAVVCICNVHMAVTARHHLPLAHVLRNAEMVTPDGAPIAWALRRAGFHNQQRINGPDLMWRYLAQAEKLGQVVSFYGGAEDTLEKLEAAMVGIPGDRDRSFRRIVTDDSGLS